MSNKNKNKKQQVKEALDGVIAMDEAPATIDLKDVSTTTTRIDDNLFVRVKSNVLGGLTFINTISHERTSWAMCGEVQLISMGNLRNMKATQPAFFTNQWVIILGVEDESLGIKPADIYKSLAITKYYENLVEPSDFEKICGWDEDEIAEKVRLMSDSAKENLTVALIEFIDKGILDSNVQIRAFEKALDCELTESK